MFTNGTASGFTNVLVGDLGPNQSTPQSTLVAGEPISSVIECQSTTRGFCPPAMTTVQMNAIVIPYHGMTIYNTTVNAIFVYTNGVWVQTATVPMPPNVQFATGTMTAAQIDGMHAAGYAILPAPGAGNMYVIHGFQLQAVFAVTFANGGNIYLQYSAAGNSGFGATENIAATLFVPLAHDQSSFVSGISANIPTATADNGVITITNDTAAFTGGAGSSAVWNVWYSIVPS